MNDCETCKTCGNWEYCRTFEMICPSCFDSDETNDTD